MSAVDNAGTLRTLFIPFFTPMKRVVERIGTAFDEGADVVRVRGFPARVYCARDPDLIEAILRDPVVGETKYPAMMPRVRRVMGSGAYVLAGGKDWKEVRQQVQAVFKRVNLMDCANCVPPLVADLLESWREHARSGTAFDAMKPLQLLVTRADLQMFFSSVLDERELVQVQEWTHYVDLTFVSPMPLSIPTPGTIRFRCAVRGLRAVMRRLIHDRRARPIERNDLLAHLLTLKRNDRSWSDEALIGELFSVYFGASVMSTSLAWTLSLVAAHPAIGEAIAQQADQVLGGRAPTVADLPSLTQVQYALKEALRLYPPSWGFPRWSEAGMHLGGVVVPPRSLVIPMIWHAHRDPQRWPDPLVFRPERFDPAGKAEIHPFSYLPFGSGPRTCLGAGLAPMVMQLVLIMILQRYRLRAAPRFAGDPIADFGFEIHPRDQVRVQVEERT